MSAIELAQQVLNRLNGEPDNFTLPEMSIAAYLDYLDSERIPEYLERTQYFLSDPAYKKRHDFYHQELDALKEAHDAGEIVTADYIRITTPQHYTNEHLRALRDKADSFIPSRNGTASNGAPVYTLMDSSGQAIWLTLEDGVWIRHNGFPYSTL